MTVHGTGARNPAGNVELGPLEELSAGARLDCDVLVVGSGAGGATAAATLAAAGRQVVVVEEGPMVTTDELRRWSIGRRLARLYRDSGFGAAVGNPPVALPMGRCIGGTTTVNSGTCFATPDDVLGEWAASGHMLAWDLTWETLADPFPFFSPSLERASSSATFPIAAVPLARARGYVEVDGERIDCDGVPLQQSHLFGGRHAHRWGGDAVRFSARADGARVEGTVFAAVQRFCGVTYHDPDGAPVYCANTGVADLRLQVDAGGRRIERTSTASCAFERGGRTPMTQIYYPL